MVKQTDSRRVTFLFPTEVGIVGLGKNVIGAQVIQFGQAKDW